MNKARKTDGQIRFWKITKIDHNWPKTRNPQIDKMHIKMTNYVTNLAKDDEIVKIDQNRPNCGLPALNKYYKIDENWPNTIKVDFN